MDQSRRSFITALGLSSGLAAMRPPLRCVAILQAERREASAMQIRLDHNENPYGPSSRVRTVMRDALGEANRYALAASDALAVRIAEFHHVTREQVILGCGSSEVLRVSAAAFLEPGHIVVAPQPTFEGITEAARSIGANVVPVPLLPNFAHDLNGMFRAINSATKLVYLCNPNNPTASLTPRTELDAFIAKLPADVHVLIDEAYHHYAGESATNASFLDRPVDNDRLIVSRTFSAVYGMAGLRVGYAIAAARVAQRMRRYLTLNNVNAIAAQCAIAALEDKEEVQHYIRQNEDDRQEFFNQAMARMLKPIGSHANFVMMDTHHPAQGVIEHFRKHNVLIGRQFPPMDTYVRTSLGTPDDMKQFWRVWDMLPFAKRTM